MNRSHACCALLLVIAVLAPAAMAQGDGGCLVELDEAASLRGAGPGVRAVVPGHGERGPRVLFACKSGRVSGVSIRLVPGQFAEARLVLTGAPEHALALVPEAGLPPDWGRVTSRRLNPDTLLVTLALAVPDGAESGRAFAGRLSLAPRRANLDVPVTLELIEETPLFRDEFDVDPVIGQFSMVEPQRDSFTAWPRSGD